MEDVQQEQQQGQEFNLDSYRALLERLQQSKRNKERLDKKVPVAVTQQTQ